MLENLFCNNHKTAIIKRIFTANGVFGDYLKYVCQYFRTISKSPGLKLCTCIETIKTRQLMSLITSTNLIMYKKPGAYGPTKDATEETQELCDQVSYQTTSFTSPQTLCCSAHSSSR